MKPRTSKGKISAVFEFTKTGVLKAIYLNAESAQDQIVLEKSIDWIINPSHLGWFRRLLRR